VQRRHHAGDDAEAREQGEEAGIQFGDRVGIFCIEICCGERC
jgi:hypothetical protein